MLYTSYVITYFINNLSWSMLYTSNIMSPNLTWILTKDTWKQVTQLSWLIDCLKIERNQSTMKPLNEKNTSTDNIMMMWNDPTAPCPQITGYQNQEYCNQVSTVGNLSSTHHRSRWWIPMWNCWRLGWHYRKYTDRYIMNSNGYYFLWWMAMFESTQLWGN